MSNENKINSLIKKRDKINNVSCSFCTAKWLQTTLYLQNGYNHSCHHPPSHKIPLDELLKDPSALHNSYFKKQQREKMINGVRPDECDYCWNIEDLGKDFFSDRHYKTADDEWAWDRFDEIANSNPYDNVHPSYLEVSFSNVCNFACAYCSPDISSKWMEDVIHNGPYPIAGASSVEYLKVANKMPYKQNEHNPYVDAFWKWFPDVFDSLRVFRITGGEPLLSKDTWKLIKWLENKENKNCTIAFNTNLVVPENLLSNFTDELNNLEDKFRRVCVFTSAESTGIQAEYARDGMDYAKWLFNLKLMLKQTKKVDFSIMTTINILSLPTFTDFIYDFLDMRKEMQNNNENENDKWNHSRLLLSVNYLRWPRHLHCNLLDIEDRKKYATAIKEIAKYYSIDNKENKSGVILYLEEANQLLRFAEYLSTAETLESNRADFIKFVDEYDRRRNKNFVEMFPEYKTIYTEWSQRYNKNINSNTE
jgi:organic radical activating enzyme